MDEFKISEKSQKELLKIARSAVETYLETKKVNRVESGDKELSVPSAVFVTLTKHGQLRGCIGTTEPQAPLCEAVNQMALAAAFQDHRFGAVSKNELKDINFEISILSPMKRIKNADEIKPNIHGVVARKGGRSGLFLPQVWEHFDNKEDFLSELCWQKAGLSRDAWKTPENIELYTFTVFAFEE